MSDVSNRLSEPMTEDTFVAVAAGNDDPSTPIKRLRRLTFWVIPANMGIGSAPSNGRRGWRT